MLENRPARLTTSPFRPARLARWCAKSTLVVGRETRTGWIEVILGSRLVELAKVDDGHVRCWLLAEASDADASRLATLEAAGAGDRLDRRLEAMEQLVESGLPLQAAGQALGLANRHDACRLHGMKRLDRRVLRALSDAGKSENHGRWLLGLSPSDAINALKEHQSVGALKAARQAEVASDTAQAPTPPSRVVDAATAAEEARIRLWLNAPVELTWKQGRGCLSVGFYDVGSLAGALEQLGRGHGEAPGTPEAPELRWVTIPLQGLDELAYLAGSADG